METPEKADSVADDVGLSRSGRDTESKAQGIRETQPSTYPSEQVQLQVCVQL